MHRLVDIAVRPDLLLVNSPLKDYDLYPKFNGFTLPTLGLGYIATCAETHGYVVDVIDAEAQALGISKLVSIINERNPRWIGLNLLAPTFKLSLKILSKINPDIKVMLGGHQAKAMPLEILRLPQIPRIDALIIGEAETRVPRLLDRVESRVSLPKVFWRDRGEPVMSEVLASDLQLLAPDINQMPFLDRKYLVQDPYDDGNVIESAMVASRGCPFDCSFCGAAISANPDISIRIRKPDNILEEITRLKELYQVQRIRFVDDLFLANRRIINDTLSAFVCNNVKFRWDATGRINLLASVSNATIDLMVEAGCNEVALGIESGSDRLLSYIDKKINTDQVFKAVERLCRAGISVKGYFILGLPTESRVEQHQTIELIDKLQALTSNLAGTFRCSAFEYRPYPGTPDWRRLVAAGFSSDEMLNYDFGQNEPSIQTNLTDRDEFNFSTGLQFGEVPVAETRRNLAELMGRQHGEAP